MLIQCPKCRTQHRVSDVSPHDKVINYYCQSCMRIVRVDLVKDEVEHSSSSARFPKVSYRRKILVVDDNDSILAVVMECLQPTGCEILFAKDGLHAIKMIKKEHPDLIILDLLLPGMTGLDVLREIRKSAYSKETPVLVMSGVVKRTNEIMALSKLGANGFISKDTVAENLLYRVNNLLEASPVKYTH